MNDINKDLLLGRIVKSRDFTALEKRYLEGLITAHRWIPCSERMPDKDPVLFVHKNIANGKTTVNLGSYHNDWFGNGFGFFKLYEVTHWMPLPEPPKGDNQ